MEALQMLKFYLKKECLNLAESWVMPESQMTEDDLDENHDLLDNLLKDAGVQDTLHSIMRSIEVDDT